MRAGIEPVGEKLRNAFTAEFSRGQRDRMDDGKGDGRSWRAVVVVR